jgi:putative intracellular protease/amidase
MTVSIDVLRPKRIVIVASNPAVSGQTGWPIGFWASELTHPYWEFTEHGYTVEIASPDGGQLQVDRWSDPDDSSHYAEEDLVSKGFLSLPTTAALLADSKALAAVNVEDYDALMLVGGQGPMYTFFASEAVHRLAAAFYERGKVTCVICHATCVLLKARLSGGELLVTRKTWTGFANSEEDYADSVAGTRIQPFRIEEEARKLPNTNFIVQRRFKPHAVRDGHLITGQQQYSGTAAARLVIEALGV